MMPKVRSVSELHKLECSEAPFVVDNFIIKNGLTLLSGAPKMGKTFMALNVGLSVSTGQPLFGVLETHQCSVLYVCMEERIERLKKRLERMMEYYKCDWPENFYVCDEVYNMYEVAAVAREVNAGLVIVDTLTALKISETVEANNFSKEYNFMLTLRKLFAKRETAILGIYHNRKNAPENTNGDVFNEISGTTGIFAGADAASVMIVKAGIITMHARGRDFYDWSMPMEFSNEYFIWTRRDTPVTPMTGDQNRIYEAIVRRRGMTASDIKEMFPHKSANSVDQLLYRMRNANQIYRRFDGIYVPVTTVVSEDDAFERGRAFKINKRFATPFETSAED